MRNSILRAALLVTVAAVLDAVISPYLGLGWISPKFTILAVVLAASGLRDLQAIMLGFFGGVLIDALAGGLFGVGALAGLVAGTLAVRAGSVRRKGAERLIMAQVVVLAVAVYNLIQLTAIRLAGLDSPDIGVYLIVGAFPDAVLNGVLAYLVGGRLLKTIREKEAR